MSDKTNNRVTLKGLLGSDPKVFKTSAKKPAVSLSVGTRERYKDADGVWQNRKTVWHNGCVAFDTDVVNDAQKFKKDDLVVLVGELNYRKFQTDSGYAKNEASIIIKSLAQLEISQ